MMKMTLVYGVFLLLVAPIFFPIIAASPTTKSNYESENSGLMDSPWPMFRHDVHHTGRSPYAGEGCTALLKWKVRIAGMTVAPPVIDKNGILYTGSVVFYALYPNGTIKWRLDNSDIGAAIGRDGTIYVASGGNLYAIDRDGNVKWKSKVGGGSVCGQPVIDKNGIIYLGTLDLSGNGRFTAIYPNGSIKWSIKLNGCSSAVINNDTVYTHCCINGYLYAIYTKNGTIKWKRWVGSVDKLSSGPSVDENGIVYYGQMSGYLYAFYPNGTLKWKLNIDPCFSPSISNGILYTVTNPTGSYYYLCAINLNGTLLWKRKVYPVSDLLTMRGLAIDKNGIIYGSGEHYVYAINPNGTLRWIWKTNDYIDSTPTIGRDGTIYVGGYDSNLDGYLYAIEPRDAADLRVSGVYYGPTFGCIKIRVKNVGCEPAYNVTCSATIYTPARKENVKEWKTYTAEVPVIDVGQEVEVKIDGIFLSPIVYLPFHIIRGPEIHLLKVEAENSNHDLLWEGGGFMQMTIIGPLVCLGGLYYWLREVMGDPHVHGFVGWETFDP